MMQGQDSLVLPSPILSGVTCSRDPLRIHKISNSCRPFLLSRNLIFLTQDQKYKRGLISVCLVKWKDSESKEQIVYPPSNDPIYGRQRLHPTQDVKDVVRLNWREGEQERHVTSDPSWYVRRNSDRCHSNTKDNRSNRVFLHLCQSLCLVFFTVK